MTLRQYECALLLTSTNMGVYAPMVLIRILCTSILQKDDRKKLDAKSKRRIFPGYGTDVKGYRLYDIQRSRVIFSRDVIFDEKHFGFEENEKNEVEKEQDDSRKVEIECEFRDQEVPVDQDTDNEVEVPEEANEEEEPRTRRSTRERWRPDYYGVWINNVECQRDPFTLQEAMIDPDKDKWSTAMQKEITHWKIIKYGI